MIDKTRIDNEEAVVDVPLCELMEGVERDPEYLIHK